MRTKQNISLFNYRLAFQAVKESILKLNPAILIKNPVIFIVGIGAFLTTIVVFGDIIQHNFSHFNLNITIWLWFTVLFANFSESIAEGRGKAQADSLRNNRKQSIARKLDGKREIIINATELKLGDIVICEAGDIIHVMER